MAETFVRVDGMCWPNPTDPADIEWTLRYGQPSRSQLLVAASMVAAYKQLMRDSRRVRDSKIAGVRRATGEDGTRDG